MKSSKLQLVVALVTLFSLTTILPVAAQFPELAIGARAGVQMSMGMFNPTQTQTLPVSMIAGAQFRMVSEKYFGFVADLNYSQRGFGSYDDNHKLMHRRMDYVELNFLSHITFGRKLFRYFIDLGPSISYLVAENQTPGAAGLIHTTPIKNRFDYAIAFCTGFEFNTRYGIYTIDARYSFGLGNVFDSKVSDQFKTSSNQNIQVAIAYLFPL